MQVEFENNIVGTAIPAGYIPACEKGFREACNSGALIGFPVEVRRDRSPHTTDLGLSRHPLLSGCRSGCCCQEGIRVCTPAPLPSRYSLRARLHHCSAPCCCFVDLQS